MKKSLKIISLSVLVGSILSFSACGTTTVSSSISSNWYKNTSISKNILGTNETLNYEVSFKAGSDKFYNYTYEKGSYTMNLINTTYGESQENVYQLTTNFLINGTVNNVAFQDSIHSVCYFKPTFKNLQPLKSVKSVKATSPSPKEESKYISYDYTYTITYDEQATNAEVAFENHKDSTQDNKTNYSISNNNTVWDNEQLIFSARGLDLASSSYFNIVNASQKEVQKILVQGSNAKKNKYTFDMGEGEKEYELNYNPVSISITNGQNSSLIACEYAALVSPTNNIYRNVLLKMSQSLSYNIGSLTYTLKTASFANS